MNVLCVKINKAGICEGPINIKVGEIYKVVREHHIAIYGNVPFYELSHHLGYAYRANQFVPIDPTEEDIREFEEAEKKEEALA